MGRRGRGSSDDDDAEWKEEGEKTEKKTEAGPKKKAKAGVAAAKVTKCSVPSSFLCSSGEVLWGHIQTVLEGAAAADHDGTSGPTRRPMGGTILQRDFVYRAAVRTGTWKVSRAYIDGDPVGFVLYHEDESPLKILERAAKVGINHSKAPEGNVVYINRYDWAWHHGNSAQVCQTLGVEESEDGDGVEGFMGGRLFFFDARNVEAFLAAIKKCPNLDRCVAFTAGAGEPFGVQVVGEDTEYELGWMVYSGKKHSTFTDADELIGMVYDCAYCGLRNREEEIGELSVD